MPQRRFPSPWIAEEHDACFIVRDHTGLNLAYVYFQNDAICRLAAKLLSRGEARPPPGMLDRPGWVSRAATGRAACARDRQSGPSSA
jgi:hypothetical protein